MASLMQGGLSEPQARVRALPTGVAVHAGWLANVYEAGYCHNEFEDGEIQTCALLALELRATRG